MLENLIEKNKAGVTSFVLPEKVKEMLILSFKMSKKMEVPIKKALFLKITFTEIHHFKDGNRRMFRIILSMQN